MSIKIPTQTQLKTRLRQSGYQSAGASGGGGWLDCHALGQVQGYASLRTLLMRAAEKLSPALREVADGTRIGRATLSCKSRDEVVAGLLAPTGAVEWRDKPPSTEDRRWFADLREQEILA